MGICGSIGSAPGSIGKSLQALRLTPRSASRTFALDDAEFGACDDGALASEHGYVAVFDGRIDNRDDLRGSLNLPDAERRTTAEILITAYQKWGDDACDHIVGDYACALWDSRQRRLVLTTDPGMLRPLFFSQDKDRILFASEQRGLFTDPDISREPDREQMAAWLAAMPRDLMRTFFRDISRVPQGHHVAWQGGRTRLHRWWRPEEVPPLKLCSDRDYEDTLRTMIDRAIACRIGPGRTIGTQLSGGLDSSTITALAARQLAEQGRGLTAFTAAPRHPVEDPTGRFSDEWPHAALVAQDHPNIDHVRIDNDALPFLEALAWQEMGNDWPQLNGANTIWATAIQQAARARRIDTLLVGSMGNMTFSYEGNENLAGKIRRGDLAGSVRAMIDLRRGGGRSWIGIAAEVARATLPPGINKAVRAALGKKEPGIFDFSAIHPDFLRQSEVAERALAAGGNMGNLSIGDSRALRMLVLRRSDHVGHIAAASRRLFGVEMLDPSSDRRLIELCLAIPDEQFIRGGVPRSLIRRTMKGLLPDTLVNERRRGYQAADWQVGFEEALPALRKEIARIRTSAYASECLDLDRLDAMLDDWPSADKTMVGNIYTSAFSRALNVGRFILRTEGSNA